MLNFFIEFLRFWGLWMLWWCRGTLWEISSLPEPILFPRWRCKGLEFWFHRAWSKTSSPMKPGSPPH